MTKEAGDRAISDLYRELQPQLVRILVSNLRAPDWAIEDACQTAWASLIEHRDAVLAGGELGWLATTATRVALRRMRRERASASAVLPAPISLADFRAPEPARELQARERLAEIRKLPLRQQRMVMLQGFGYEYEEIAAVTGESRRTVARQLTRARQRLLHLVDEG